MLPGENAQADGGDHVADAYYLSQWSGTNIEDIDRLKDNSFVANRTYTTLIALRGEEPNEVDACHTKHSIIIIKPGACIARLKLKANIPIVCCLLKAISWIQFIHSYILLSGHTVPKLNVERQFALMRSF